MGTGRSVLLVDADTYGGSVAQHLGLLDESPGIAAAVRSAGRGRLEPDGLRALAPEVLPGVRVLTGISRASRWSEVSGAGLDQVWEVARRTADWTVVDCGFGIERDGSPGFDGGAPERDGATLGALRSADVHLVVGSSDPIGLQRLVRALGDLDELTELTELTEQAGTGRRTPRVVVANRVRAGVAGAGPRRAVRDVLARFAGVEEPVLVDEDRPSFDAAVLGGRTLGEVRPGSAGHRDLVALTEAVRSVGESLLDDRRQAAPLA
ncbi:hypothetical protein GCM10025865_22180 [Paraoerskovia sediminicola]|uniref:MinD-like ATPase involved in chromosome partitioning or flagellar assembly n=1 Tax=Paraoerskovia sediminicola TaxID=1138587 RepID=A0ABN6XDJ2_9CELL|nr:hypothetical protein [Paraoerskovia sediminicola]BDZ42919.1 hypothetical protein GCM10025865_22180 [Paraoerskovia sediminicola]